MGTKMHCKSYFPGLYSMRDLNDDSSSSSWPPFCGDKMVANGQYRNGFMPKTLVDGYTGHGKDTLKQKMLEHEAVFKNQVLELHRLYRIQRDMMEEFKRKEVHADRTSIEPASSSSLHGHPVPSEETRKWHMAGFPLSNSSHGRPSVAGFENFISPPSCTKEKPTQPGQLSYQNGSTIKNSEASDSRPLKVRKKLFDLQLPANEYIDPEEEGNLWGCKQKLSSHSHNDDSTNGPQRGMEIFLGSRPGAKTDHLNEASASAGCFRGSIGLADLNEPIQIEEAIAPSSIDFLGHSPENRETKTINQHAKSKVSYLSVTGEPLHVPDRISIIPPIESQDNGRGWFPHLNGAGSSSPGNLGSVMQSCQPDKSPLSSHPGQGTIKEVRHPHGMYSGSYNREEKWREGLRHGFEPADRCYSHSNNSHLETISSHAHDSYPFVRSSSFASSWLHSVSYSAQTSSSFTQKIPTLETPGNSVVPRSRPSALGQQSLEGNWHVDSSSKLTRGLRSEPKSNGFYHDAGIKEMQFQSLSAGFDYMNCSRGDNRASERSTDHGSANLPKGLYHTDSKTAIDINLNEALPRSLANEDVVLLDLNMTDRKSKPDDNFPALPWLKPKPLHVDEVTVTRRSELSKELGYCHASSNGLCSRKETVQEPNQLYSSKWDSQIPRDKEVAQTPTVKKILGFPIFERYKTENEMPSPVSTSAGRAISSDERKNGIIDINVACEPDEQISVEEPTTEKENQEKATPIFDLNSSVSDSEDPSPPRIERNGASVKIILEIDLEVPVVLESEDDCTELKEKILNEVSSQSFDNQNKEIQQDEVFRDAAETLVAMSLCSQADTEDRVCLPFEASLGEALLRLADAASSDPNEDVNTSGKESRGRERSPLLDSSQEIDDFEAMILQLAETKPEDYMPQPFLPELPKVEEAGARPLQTRTRRGHARRGRQWRDFQRDILPGLASLSRPEMTEDLQIFGGMMRATGHTWNSGLIRRNGTRNMAARGRRRAVVEVVPPAIARPVCTQLVQQLSSIEPGLEDRSLTGWGKTTRRPRRQRCSAGNPPMEEALLS